jgi:hypothetical protein
MSCLNKVLGKSTAEPAITIVFVGSYFYFKKQASSYLQNRTTLLTQLDEISGSGFYFYDTCLNIQHPE